MRPPHGEVPTCPPGYSRALWGRLALEARRKVADQYWYALPLETRQMLARKYGVL